MTINEAFDAHDIATSAREAVYAAFEADPTDANAAAHKVACDVTRSACDAVLATPVTS